MLDRFCAKCGRPRTAGDTFCGNCGRRFDDALDDANASSMVRPEPEKPAAPPRPPAAAIQGEHVAFNRNFVIVLVCSALLVPVLVFFGAVIGPVEEGPGERRIRVQQQQARQRGDDETAARAFAEQFVRKALKAPSTAKFGPYGSVQVTPMGGDAWTVIGYVDAQNGFGAMLRSQWLACRLGGYPLE